MCTKTNRKKKQHTTSICQRIIGIWIGCYVLISSKCMTFIKSPRHGSLAWIAKALFSFEKSNKHTFSFKCTMNKIVLYAFCQWNDNTHIKEILAFMKIHCKLTRKLKKKHQIPNRLIHANSIYHNNCQRQ